MINPLRSEAEAYRFLLLTVGYFAAIAIAALAIGKWAGLVVFLALTLAGARLRSRARRVEPRAPGGARPAAERANERRILVVANETVGGERLRDEIRSRSEGYDEQVLVVTPALNSPLEHWASDEDGARVAGAGAAGREPRPAPRGSASTRRARSATASRCRRWRTRSGSSAPTRSSSRPIPRAARTGSSEGIVEAARERFAVPITHVVVDLERPSQDRAVTISAA